MPRFSNRWGGPVYVNTGHGRAYCVQPGPGSADWLSAKASEQAKACPQAAKALDQAKADDRRS